MIHLLVWVAREWGVSNAIALLGLSALGAAFLGPVYWAVSGVIGLFSLLFWLDLAPLWHGLSYFGIASLIVGVGVVAVLLTGRWLRRQGSYGARYAHAVRLGLPHPSRAASLSSPYRSSLVRAMHTTTTAQKEATRGRNRSTRPVRAGATRRGGAAVRHASHGVHGAQRGGPTHLR